MAAPPPPTRALKPPKPSKPIVTNSFAEELLKKRQKEAGESTERKVLFKTTVKRKGGFVGEEITYSDGTTEMIVIEAGQQEEVSTKVIKAKLVVKTPVVGIPLQIQTFAKEKEILFKRLSDQHELQRGAQKEYTPTEADLGSCLSITISFEADVFELQSEPVRAFLSHRNLFRFADQQQVPYSEYAKSPESFRVGQYNIMAECHTKAFAYPWADPGILNYQYRLPLLFREIETYNADILTMQEIDLWHYNHSLKSKMDGLGYDHVYIYSEKNDRTKEGVAIWWKRDRFDLLATAKQDSSQFTDIETDKSNNLYSKLIERLGYIQHHNQLCAVMLQDKCSGKKLAIATAHMLFTGSWPMDEVYQMQYVQLEKYLQVIHDSLLKSDISIPVLFCGDFNNGPKSLAYEFIRKGVIESSHPELTRNGTETLRIPHGLQHSIPNLESVYALRPNGELVASNYTEHVGTLDYIFFNKEMFLPNSVVEPYDSTVYMESQLPNACLPSDHISLWADFEFNSK